MKDEDGVNAGARNIGRFFLFAIPAILGVAALIWFGAYVGVMKYKKELEQQKRAAVYVGAQETPKEKLKINVVMHDCTEVVGVDLNGRDLIIYAKNNCHTKLDYLAWHWELNSPDGTIVDSDYTNLCPRPKHGQKAECKMRISDDERAVSLTVWTSRRTD